MHTVFLLCCTTNKCFARRTTDICVCAEPWVWLNICNFILCRWWIEWAVESEKWQAQHVGFSHGTQVCIEKPFKTWWVSELYLWHHNSCAPLTQLIAIKFREFIIIKQITILQTPNGFSLDAFHWWLESTDKCKPMISESCNIVIKCHQAVYD